MFKSRLTQTLKSVLGDNDKKKEATAIESFQQQDFSGNRVLLVEDVELNIEVATEILNIVGIRVEQAMNGQLAVNKVMEHEAGYFDLIFMDIKMEKLNGLKTAEEIRRMDSTVGLIFLTSLKKYVWRGYEYGAVNYLLKPVKYGVLKMELDRYFARYQGKR